MASTVAKSFPAPPIEDGEEEEFVGPELTNARLFECPRHPSLKVLKRGTGSKYLKFARGVFVTEDREEIAQLSAKHIRNRYGVYPSDVPSRTYLYEAGDVPVVFHSQEALSAYQKIRDKGQATGYLGWND